MRIMGGMTRAPRGNCSVSQQGQLKHAADGQLDYVRQSGWHIQGFDIEGVPIISPIRTPAERRSIRFQSQAVSKNRSHHHNVGEPSWDNGLSMSVVAPGDYRPLSFQRETVNETTYDLEHVGQPRRCIRLDMYCVSPDDDLTRNVCRPSR